MLERLKQVSGVQGYELPTQRDTDMEGRQTQKLVQSK